MKLARLEIFGFKSFLNRTVFQFGEGITSIVGPNGCGKSNIVDAIVWVLGERGTKSLRVKDMGDVIFHGSNGKRPVNIAEVTLDLTEDDREFIVKRRIYRDGTNEYSLNGKIVRLKDVQDAFLGTGLGTNSYAIIEQGRIEALINMKPAERRIVIEEASGITRFEEKKRDAVHRMEETTSNLERVEDVYREVTASFAKAEQEWERWKAYQELADRLHEIDRQLLLDGYAKLRKRMTKVRERQVDLEEEILQKEADRSTLKEEFEAKESEFSLTDSIIRQLEVDLKSKEKDMESRLLEIEYLGNEVKRLQASLKGLSEEEASITAETARHENEINTLEEKSGTLTGELMEEREKEARTRQVAQGFKANIEEHERTLEESRTKLFVSMSSLTETRNRIAEIERLAQERQKRIERQATERRELETLLASLDGKRKALHDSLRDALQEKESLSVRESALLAERESTLREMERLKGLAESTKGEKRVKEEFLKQLGGYIEGSRDATRAEDRLVNLIKVDEGKIKALERFFSEELEYEVMKNDSIESVASAVQEREGNRIFFSPGGIFRKAGDDVEVDIAWITGIEEALSRVAGGEQGIFINDDIYVDSRGIILSGTGSKKIDVRQFKEKLKLEKELQTLSADTESHDRALAALRPILEACDGRCRSARSDREAQEGRVKALEKDLLMADAQWKNTADRLAALEAVAESPDDTGPGAREELDAQRRHYEEEKAGVETSMTRLRETLAGLKKEYEAAQSAWHGVTIEIERKTNTLKSLSDNRERSGAAIRSLTGQAKGLKERFAAIEHDIEGRTQKTKYLERSYDELRSELQKHVARYEELKTMLGTLHAQKQTLQESIDAAAKEMERVRARKENAEKDLAVLEEKRLTIIEHLRDTYNIGEPDEISVQLPANIEEERESLTERIAGMGEINFRAEKEYLELRERISFLDKQKEDLIAAMESLKKTITKIDQFTRELFTETFDKVNTAFIRFTDLLFKGGKGYLAINAEQAGVDLFVQPPGKKVTRMELLSGGEKALISLAFLLALMDTKPSPFALMDEIDAPLDDANLAGLLDIIRGMSLKSQIIFITHNRITMEYSDMIYGITMEEQGISKTVSVRL
ncbi:MAG: chromosome segregation protein SMC [Syntrophorhabdaceae bacterium]|nr:chromosome segregation protein SMC [Syntrophorhabdaceae bacterium]